MSTPTIASWVLVLSLLHAVLAQDTTATPSPLQLAPSQVDGETTFCFRESDTPMPGTSRAVFPSKGSDCALQLTVTQVLSSDTSNIVHQPIDFRFEITAHVSSRNNALNVTALRPTAKNVNGAAVQLYRALVFGCDGAVYCDLIQNATMPKFAANEDGTGNFTANKATFVQRLTFATPGVKTVVGNAVLPPEDGSTHEFLNFVIFLPVTILAGEGEMTTKSASLAPSTQAPSAKESSHSNLFVILGGIAAAVIVVGLAYYAWVRRKPTPKFEEVTIDTRTMSPRGKVAFALMHREDIIMGNSSSVHRPQSMMHREAADDMTFQLPDTTRLSSDSEASMGTEPANRLSAEEDEDDIREPSSHLVPAPHGQQYEIVDGNPYCRHPGPPPRADDMIHLPSEVSTTTLGEDDGSMRTIEFQPSRM